ncbi:pH-responsive protein 1 [[Candida] anglica]|uniref:1,3-beta-glucanosyltransferase n=1 Tax=[Candida] anglica TaxID=148631 RepID=A0ABP0EKH5_9ASCO
MLSSLTLILSCFAAKSIAANVNMSHSVTNYETIAPIEVVGSKLFYQGSETQFFIKGIAYQQMRQPNETYSKELKCSYIDPLANATTCLRDLELLKELGVNLVRVYQIDPLANHDICMEAFAREGVYVLADLSEPELSINRENPTWNTELYDRYTSVVDSLNKYNNVMGFIAGNEVTTSKSNTDASPFVKAAFRDIKRYIAANGYRSIPVGYASNDDSETRMNLSNYFVCQDESGTKDSIADFLGINMYEWCGYSSYSTSGYRERTAEYSNFPVPIFFSEYGCNTAGPSRPFTEVEAIYGSTMSSVWSGAIAYSYFEGENHYGIVQERPDGTVQKMGDFETLSMRLNSAQPKSAIKKQQNSGKIPNCPKQSSVWKASSVLPPTPDEGKCECIQSTFSCIVSPYKDIGDYQQFLEEVCTSVDCSRIRSDSSRGVYGSLSDCNLKQQLSYALNQFYLINQQQESSCDFSGRAILVNGNTDLEEIYSQDGRTCQEAIGIIEWSNNSTNETRNVIPTLHSNMTEYGDINEQRNFKQNHNRSMSSNGIKNQVVGGIVKLLMFMSGLFFVL